MVPSAEITKKPSNSSSFNRKVMASGASSMISSTSALCQRAGWRFVATLVTKIVWVRGRSDTILGSRDGIAVRLEWDQQPRIDARQTTAREPRR